MDIVDIKEEQGGICPHCEQTGIVGHACTERACINKGHRFIPKEYFSAGENEPIDTPIGLQLRDFLIVKLLGRGNFGRVYLCYEPVIGLKAALKILDTDGLPKHLEQAVREKFESEARALASLQHPNILRLMHYGQFQNRPYLLTDFIEGGVTLEDEIDRRAMSERNFDLKELENLFRQLLDGLESAHKRNIIHRDIKPANLMLQDIPGYPIFLSILDFGLAKFLDAGNTTIATSGTPDYMSPEQLTRENLGPWTDLYAVGTIAFELLTGRLPFTAENLQETFFLKVDPLYDPTTRLNDLSLPVEVANFFSRALSTDHTKRYQNVDAFRTGIKRAFESLKEMPKVSFAGISRHALSISTSLAPTKPHQQKSAPRKPTENRSSEEAFRQWIKREEIRLSSQIKK